MGEGQDLGYAQRKATLRPGGAEANGAGGCENADPLALFVSSWRGPQVLGCLAFRMSIAGSKTFMKMPSPSMVLIAADTVMPLSGR